MDSALDPLDRVSREAEQIARSWADPPPSVRRLDLLRAFARGAGWELYFDADGQVVLHTGLYTGPEGDVGRIAAPCVPPR